jgi:hypothetical protein
MFVFASFCLSMVFGHELVYNLAAPSTLEGVHGYMDEFAWFWRGGLAGCVLFMFHRMFARGGSVDDFLQLPSRRSLLARMAFGGTLATSMLFGQEIIERMIAGTGVVLELRFVAAIVAVQFAIAVVLLVLPAWTRSAGLLVVDKVVGFVRKHCSAARMCTDRGRVASAMAYWDVQQRSDGVIWRRRAIPLRGSP